MRRIRVSDDPRCEGHEAPPGHPETPERLRALRGAIQARAADLELRKARPAEDGELLSIHPRSHLAHIEESARRAPVQIDRDTFASASSAEVARLAAGSAIDTVRAVARGECDAAFAAIRPPGHHAEADRAMGFCLYNNVAVAVAALRESEGAPRVLILDWDVHHGNGTQHLFETERDVLYCSIHQFPFYPGTGAVGEIGIGRGEGSTVNVPLPAGCGDLAYRHAVDRVVAPIAQGFAPDLIVVSCGFDAHESDPLGQMQVSSEGFGGLSAQLRVLADALCGGRLAFVLEGGYSPVGLEGGAAALLDVLLAETPEAPPLPDLSDTHPLWGVIESLHHLLGATYPHLGAKS